MPKYALKCSICDRTFASFEKYENHVTTTHKDRLNLRMKPEIIKVD
ncbi:MAG: hypothetical protein ACE5J2_02395 [Nitrososphaerales archaeon]